MDLRARDGGYLLADAWTHAHSPMTAAFAAGSGTVLTRHIDRTRRSTIARFRGSRDRAEVDGPFPSQLGRSQTVDMMLVFVAATSLGGDTLLVFSHETDATSLRSRPLVRKFALVGTDC